MPFDYSEFKKFQNNMQKMQKEFNDFLKKFLLEEAIRAWILTKENTPVDTGLLRNMWQVGDSKNVVAVDHSKEATQKFIQDYIRSTEATLKSVKIEGNDLLIEIYNNVEYAGWVEDGHRQEVGRYVPAIGKRLKNSYVEGKHMAKIAIEQIEREIPARFEKQFKGWLKSLEII